MENEDKKNLTAMDLVGVIIYLAFIALVGHYLVDIGRQAVERFAKPADTNLTLVYGETGYPKNCRAIITDNIEGVNRGEYTPEEALGSINRNCGRDGYSWGQ